MDSDTSPGDDHSASANEASPRRWMKNLRRLQVWQKVTLLVVTAMLLAGASNLLDPLYKGDGSNDYPDPVGVRYSDPPLVPISNRCLAEVLREARTIGGLVEEGNNAAATSRIRDLKAQDSTFSRFVLQALVDDPDLGASGPTGGFAAQRLRARAPEVCT